MDTLVLAFDKQLDSLFGAEAMDISTDITVLENLLAQEGLNGSDFKRTEQSGEPFFARIRRAHPLPQTETAAAPHTAQPSRITKQPQPFYTNLFISTNIAQERNPFLLPLPQRPGRAAQRVPDLAPHTRAAPPRPPRRPRGSHSRSPSSISLARSAFRSAHASRFLPPVWSRSSALGW